MRRGVGAVFIAALALAAAAPAQRVAGAQFGIQDDAWLMYGPGTLAERVTTLAGPRRRDRPLHAALGRRRAGGSRPTPREPGRPRVRWGALRRRARRAARAAGSPSLVTLCGSPRWANGGGAPNRLPTYRLRRLRVPPRRRASRGCASGRSGTSRTAGRSRVPVSPSALRAARANPAYAALHARVGANQVAGGVTSPREDAVGHVAARVHAGHARGARAARRVRAEPVSGQPHARRRSHAARARSASRWRACRRSAPT